MLKSFCKCSTLSYYGNVFPNGEKNISAEKIFNILALMGNVRHFCFHYGNAKFNNKIDEKYNDAWLYNLEKLEEPFKNTLDDIYRNAVKKINDNFFEISKNNIYILHKALSKKDYKIQSQIVAKEYYDFAILKCYKNLGFSIKKLREKMLELTDAQYLKSEEYNSVRHKMYTLLDFIIYYVYTALNAEKTENIVEQLRSALDDEEKEKIYADESIELWEKLSGIINNSIEPYLHGDAIKGINDEPGFSSFKVEIDDGLKENTDLFCELIYLMTRFLDGKEINDLLTTLINKFDNIQSFIKTAEELDVECEFTDEYSFFKNSKDICSTLREINSFARMEKPIENAKKIMYIEALEILGMQNDKTEEFVDKILEENGVETDKISGFRKFIESNVIKSSRFQYLIKYNNTKNIRELAHNKNIVEFVLSGIPETQLQRYFTACGGDEYILDKNQFIASLTKIITKLDYAKFEKVKQNSNTSLDSGKEKAEMQTVISLYLTVLYLLTKNLVYINSRYVIAFHCLERDTKIYTENVFNKYEKDDNGNKYGYFGLTKEFIEKKYLNKHSRECLTTNLNEIDQYVCRSYRNCVAHLEPIVKLNKYINDIGKFSSYYQLYHYIMQRVLKEKCKNDDKIKVFVEKLDRHHTYCKDFVKVLNIPFGYNLARYKNLSIEDLFDKNNMRKCTEDIKASSAGE